MSALAEGRLLTLLAELERQADSARHHKEVMALARKESEEWSDPADRAWAIKAHQEAIAAHIDAERNLAEGRQIVARVSEV